MDAVTPNRYTPVPVNVRPDVPHYVNQALAEIGMDMATQILRLGGTIENLALLGEEVDARAPEKWHAGPVAGEDLLAAITDALGRMTWLAARTSDGGPTDWALKMLSDRLNYEQVPGFHSIMFSVTDKDGHMTDLTVRASDGQFPDFVIDRLRTRLGVVNSAGQLTARDRHVRSGEVLPALADPKRLAGWGSSSMQGIASKLEGQLPAGVKFHRGGKGGETASMVAARLGSVPALLTVDGGSIPAAAAAVKVTSPALPAGSGGYLQAYSGTLAGVRGSVSWSGSAYVFTRAAAGAAVAVPAGTPFRPDAAAVHRDAMTLLWMGKNDLTGKSGAAEQVIQLTDASVDWLAPLVSRALVLGHFVDTGTAANSSERAQIMQVNAAHLARYGDLFLDVHAFLTGPDIWAATKLTPTADDLAEQALGNKPPSVSADNGHLNSAGYDAVAKLITARLALLGWL